ncbi:hypothetical protein [Phenylobacterium sp.]|uniref:hypothetical protein n=1 Tax=Phenylobacterium sp. TaxID=1871053 RepID=UPI002DF323D3|nr:hypothetical protein [Phenylobacterium sp.]
MSAADDPTPAPPAGVEALRAEAVYAAMYDAPARHAVKAHYEDTCLNFARAIAAAREAGRPDEAARLQARLDHVRAVYDHQFRGL